MDPLTSRKEKVENQAPPSRDFFDPPGTEICGLEFMSLSSKLRFVAGLTAGFSRGGP